MFCMSKPKTGHVVGTERGTVSLLIARGHPTKNLCSCFNFNTFIFLSYTKESMEQGACAIFQLGTSIPAGAGC